MPMRPFFDLQFGDKIVTLMAALVLVLQIAMVAQRWIVTHIRIFAAQSFFLAMIAATIAWFNHAPHIYIAAALTLVVKVILVPILFERLCGAHGNSERDRADCECAALGIDFGRADASWVCGRRIVLSSGNAPAWDTTRWPWPSRSS